MAKSDEILPWRVAFNPTAFDAEAEVQAFAAGCSLTRITDMLAGDL